MMTMAYNSMIQPDNLNRKQKRTSATKASSGPGSQGGRKLKQYYLEEKLDIIDYAKVIGNRAAGREFNVAESSIREWRKNEQRLRTLLDADPERSGVDDAHRRCISEELEANLLVFVASRKPDEPPLTWQVIKEKANDLWKKLYDEGAKCKSKLFTAKMGWIARFVRRHNIAVRAPKSLGIVRSPISASEKSSVKRALKSSSIQTSTMNCSRSLKVTSDDDNKEKRPVQCSSSSAVRPLSSFSTFVGAGDGVGMLESNFTAQAGLRDASAGSSNIPVKKRRKNSTPKKVVFDSNVRVHDRSDDSTWITELNLFTAPNINDEDSLTSNIKANVTSSPNNEKITTNGSTMINNVSDEDEHIDVCC